MNLRLFKSNSGFTLIETLIALAILMIAVLSIVQLFPLGLKASYQAKNLSLATNLAQAKLEELISDNYDNLAVGITTEDTLSSIDSDFSTFIRVTEINYVDGNLNSSIQDLGLKKVVVYVSWPNSFTGDRSTTSLVTLINEF